MGKRFSMKSAEAVLMQGRVGLLPISSYQGVLRGDQTAAQAVLLGRMSRSCAQHIMRSFLDSWLNQPGKDLNKKE